MPLQRLPGVAPQVAHSSASPSPTAAVCLCLAAVLALSAQVQHNVRGKGTKFCPVTGRTAKSPSLRMPLHALSSSGPPWPGSTLTSARECASSESRKRLESKRVSLRTTSNEPADQPQVKAAGGACSGRRNWHRSIHMVRAAPGARLRLQASRVEAPAPACSFTLWQRGACFLVCRLALVARPACGAVTGQPRHNSVEVQCDSLWKRCVRAGTSTPACARSRSWCSRRAAR